MWKVRIAAVFILILGASAGYFIYGSQTDPTSDFPFKLGLDLSGGSHLVYRADTATLSPAEVQDSMDALRNVIERRVNLFGVSEPIVQVEGSSILSGVDEERLIVELPGVTDLNEAIRLIGETPVLEFRIENTDYGTQLERDGLFRELELAIVRREEGEVVDFSQFAFLSGENALFMPTELTGRYLKAAQLNFGGQYSGQLTNEPIVLLEFNSEGSNLFATITREHTNERLAIFLDGAPISIPVIIQEITGGTATISGGFSPAEARALVRDLNFGALPVPIELIETQAIGASLGGDALTGGVRAGLFGLMLVAAFMVLWYRLPGLLSVVALAFYIIAMLTLFKLIPVTLTAAGIAGFILSIGMAVDANVLIFERMREELKAGKEMKEAVTTGFSRAWPSIRDGNVSSILTAVILFWFGTSLVKGFALVFGIGVLLSMLSAITVTRTFLQSLGRLPFRGVSKFLLGSGISL